MLELRGSGAVPLEAEDPRRIGSIPLAGRLGAGGMGRVYLGVQEGRYVAVKQLLASVVGEDEDFLRRFGHELDNLAQLPAEATAPLLASDRTARPPWFATAYVPGLTLREAIELHGGPLPVEALWVLLREAASSLLAVHALEMVHRDLKPSNIMLTVDGLTLIDFGIARAAEQSQLTRTGMVVGTPAYMAPEQAAGTRVLSGATDVFALGSVLAYAACGRPPFGDESGHAVLYRIVHEEPDLEPLRELAPDLAEVVAACLDKDPEGRPTAAELFDRASRHGPFAAPLWPAAISESLSERAAFAADVQEIDLPTAALTNGKPESEKESEPKPEPKAEPKPETDSRPERPARPERPERRRRNRVLLAVVPVVIAAGGTTLAIQYLPHTSSPNTEAQDTPSTSVTAGPTASDQQSGKASAAKPSARKKTGKDNEGEQDKGKRGKDGSQAAAAGGAGTGAQNGTSGSGDSGGSGPSGGGTSATTSPPASGTHRYRNGDNGKCVAQVYGAADHRDCSDPTTKWTVRSRSNGSFQLVNQQTGQCLQSNGLGQAVFVSDCAQDTGRLWHTGSGGSLRSNYSGGCLDLGMSSGLTTNKCTGEASQRWTRQT